MGILTPTNEATELAALNEMTILASQLRIGYTAQIRREAEGGWCVEICAAWEQDRAKLRETLKRRGYLFEVWGDRTRVYRSMPASLG